ncbi:optic atrophy 3 protein [Cystoisospora suis]|uniref:Optic atrophy 3 protein n=1 Tax=Cystoisospora suis TaxID=483139 RepID=A0A2C6KMG4_9APIC|nr:optic atrophy 3 protein [Cystoisospora suis]
MVFPAAKLLTVALRQLSKPMAQYMQRRAQNSDVFKGLCVGLASRYNNVEQRIVNRFYGRTNKAATIRKLNEAKAIELGATVFGECFIFGIAAVALALEYRRSVLKEAAKERELMERLSVLEAQILQLQGENDRMLERIFPHEKHSREEVDVAVDAQPGWLAWLAHPITAVFSREAEAAPGRQGAEASRSAANAVADSLSAPRAPSGHMLAPPELCRPLNGSGFSSSPSIASVPSPNTIHEAISGAISYLGTGHLHRVPVGAPSLPDYERSGVVSHGPTAGGGTPKQPESSSEAPPVTDN